jgi:DNA-binding transcriptional regulator YdaS (Cro superfamily)
MTAEAALAEAFRRAGGRAPLARKLGISSQATHYWPVAPARHVTAIARLTGVSLRDLRPDLYPRPKKSGPELADYWRARKAFVAAIEATPLSALGLTRESRELYLSGIELPGLEVPR